MAEAQNSMEETVIGVYVVRLEGAEPENDLMVILLDGTLVKWVLHIT